MLQWMDLEDLDGLPALGQGGRVRKTEAEPDLIFGLLVRSRSMPC